MSSAGFEPAIAVIAPPQTYALGHTATGIGLDARIFSQM